ncbi:MAG: universal stress protein [Bacteroidota bacterium]
MIRIDRILVGHDFSSFSDAALLEAARLSRRVGAAVHVAFVEVLHNELPHVEVNAASRVDYFRGELRKRFSSMANGYEQYFDGVELHYEVLRDVAAAPALIAYAEETKIDLIVVGTHGRRGVRRLLMGSVAEEVVRRAPCPVLTINEELSAIAEFPGRTIVAPVDFSKHSLLAVRHVKELASAMDVDVVLTHVLEERLHPAFYNTGMFSQYDDIPNIDQRISKELKAFFEKAEGPEVGVEYAIRRGHAVKEIVRVAREYAPSMIVMATHGLTGLDHFLLGSVTEKVIRHAERPVLTIKSFGKRLVDDPPTRTEVATS